MWYTAFMQDTKEKHASEAEIQDALVRGVAEVIAREHLEAQL